MTSIHDDRAVAVASGGPMRSESAAHGQKRRRGGSRSAHRWLAPEDGRLVIGIARPDSLSFRLFGDRWPSLQALRHTMLFTRRTLCAMVEKAGLRVVKWLPWGAFFAGAAFNLSKKSGLYTYVGRLADTWRVEDVEINRGGCLPAFHQRWHAQFAGHGEAD